VVGRLAILTVLLALGCAPRAAVRPAGTAAGTVFRYRGEAEEVWVSGDFSGWEKVPLRRHGEEWTAEQPLAPGRYEYRMEVRDGTGVHVVFAEGVERADDGFGGENAVLRVER
jgi:1,4-alpha-glucan branching enzyme